MFATAGTATALGLASLVPNAPMMTTFALSCWVGEYAKLFQVLYLTISQIGND
jgi:hypothetical protein